MLIVQEILLYAILGIILSSLSLGHALIIFAVTFLIACVNYVQGGNKYK